MSRDPEPLIEALKRLASGETRPEDLEELQQARNSGRITIASNGGGAVRGIVVAPTEDVVEGRMKTKHFY